MLIVTDPQIVSRFKYPYVRHQQIQFAKHMIKSSICSNDGDDEMDEAEVFHLDNLAGMFQMAPIQTQPYLWIFGGSTMS